MVPLPLKDRIRPPAVVILGSPAQTAELAAELGPDRAETVTCYQMDLCQSARLRAELAARGRTAPVITAPDLWDLPADYQTALYPVPEGGERQLKIDMIEQAYHVLRPGGTLVVLSPYDRDEFFPPALKKVFGRFHAPGSGRVFWSRRDGARPRRRHEVTFQVRAPDGSSLRFLSRPGTFSFGRFDNGARALVESITVHPGDCIVDMGCGCGTNGVWAGRLSGPTGFVAFIDSNVRALVLAEHNARANGLAHFQTVGSDACDDLAAGGFDVALANPPYYAQFSIARHFVVRCRTLLKPGGRFYLVTKQADQVGPFMAEAFGRTDVVTRRGYQVLCARAPQGAP